MEHRLQITSTPPEENLLSRGTSLILLGAITGLALVLRLLHLNLDLWLDEISPVVSYGSMSLPQVMATYLGSNNHPLNTLLVNLSIALFGQQEWAIRLPAVVFGTATIPAMYWVARLALSRAGSLGAALLLAVSYHHIFFSQNARGYAAYLLFALLSTGLLCKGLQNDRFGVWTLYVVTMFLDFAALLNSAFVFLSHIMVGAAACLAVRRQGEVVRALAQRLIGVFAIAAFLVFQFYSMILPEAYVYMRAVYTQPAAGYSFATAEFWRELFQGLSAALGKESPALALALLAVAASVGLAGFLALLRRHWVLTAALTLPGVVTVLFVIANRLATSPRLFLLALPLAILVGVQGIYAVARFAGKMLARSEGFFVPAAAATMVLAAAAVSLSSLPRYYSIPKQPYRASLRYLRSQLQSDDIVLAVYLVELGYRYYGGQFGLVEGRNCFFVRSEEAFDSVLSSHREGRVFLVTTFPRALRISYPSLNARIQNHWEVARTFPATIGDGEISVWRRK